MENKIILLMPLMIGIGQCLSALESQSVSFDNLTPAIQPNGIFQRVKHPKTPEKDGILLSLAEARSAFNKFDLKKNYSHNSLLNFRNTCRDSIPQFVESDKNFKYRHIAASQWKNAEEFNACIYDNSQGAVNRAEKITIERENIINNYYSWSSIFMQTGFSLGLLGGYAFINPWLPSSMQINADPCKWIATAGIAAGINGMRMFGMKKYQDNKMDSISEELKDIYETVSVSGKLLDQIVPFCKK